MGVVYLLVDASSFLPKKTTCKDLIFQSKYSFAVFDKAAIQTDDFEEYLETLITDNYLEGICFKYETCSKYAIAINIRFNT